MNISKTKTEIMDKVIKGVVETKLEKSTHFKTSSLEVEVMDKIIGDATKVASYKFCTGLTGDLWFARGLPVDHDGEIPELVERLLKVEGYLL